MSTQHRNTTDFVWIKDLPEWDSDQPDGYVTGTVNKKRTTDRQTSGREHTRRSADRSHNGRPSGGRTTRPGAANRSYSRRGNSAGNRSNSARNRGRYRRKKAAPVYKIIALAFIIVIVCIAGFFVRNFGSGAKAAKNGMVAFENGYYDQAVRDFKLAVSYDKDNSDYINKLGMAQIQNSEFDAALDTFNNLLDSSRKKADKELAYRGIGMVQLYTNNYGDAVLALSEAASYIGKELSEVDKDVLYYLAEAQMKNGDPVGAVLSYSTILEQEESVMGYMLRGVAYEQVGDVTNAEADLNKVITLAGENHKIYMTLYQVLMNEGKEKDAEKILKKAVELPVVNGEDYSNRGFMYTYLEENDLAMADFDKAIEMSHFEAYFGKAVLLMNSGKYQEAKECFRIYFNEFKDNAKAYNQYGICLLALGEYKEAIDAFSLGIEANDRTVLQELRFNIVVAYEKSGAWHKAEEELKIYMEKYPGDAGAEKELRFIKSRQHTTAADAENHPEIRELEGESGQSEAPSETENRSQTEESHEDL